MADLTPIPSTPQTPEQAYQPVSGYVVAAGIATAAFVLALLAVAYPAVTSRRSVFAEELLVLPIMGIILSTIGRSHVRNSDGTKTGLKLAGICWWVCILGGAGFVAYLIANDMAIKSQSARFIDREFLKKLDEGLPQHAFLALVPPEERGRAAPVDPKATDPESVRAREYFESAYTAFGYPMFKHSEMLRLFLRNKNALEIEHLGTKDVGQEEAGFKATHVYRVLCPEGVFELHIKAQALEGRKGGAPQWRIPGQPTLGVQVPVRDISNYGGLVVELERDADGFARQWMSHVSNNHPAVAHLLTLPEAERKSLEMDFTKLMVMGGPIVTMLPVGPEWLPPERAKAWQDRVAAKASATGFDDLQAVGFFQADDSGTPISGEKLDKLRSLWQSPLIMHPSQRIGVGPGGPPPDAAVMEFYPDRILGKVPADLYFDGRVVFVRCHVLVECRNPELLAAVDAARRQGATAKMDGSVLLQKLPPCDWRITGLVTDMEPQSPAADQKTVTGGPGAPGGPRGPGAPRR